MYAQFLQTGCFLSSSLRSRAELKDILVLRIVLRIAGVVAF